MSQTLAGLLDQDSYYDMVDGLEEQGIEVLGQRHLSRKGTDLDLVEQFNIYEVRTSSCPRVRKELFLISAAFLDDSSPRGRGRRRPAASQRAEGPAAGQRRRHKREAWPGEEAEPETLAAESQRARVRPGVPLQPARSRGRRLRAL